MLFLHGWAMTPAVWRPLIAALDAESFEIQAPALPGHGSIAINIKPTLAAWADALAPALPFNATVIGWSLGALLALELARTRPEHVGRLILLGATPRFVSAPDWPHGLDAEVVASFTEGYSRQPAQTLRRFLTLQTLGESAIHRTASRIATPPQGAASKASVGAVQQSRRQLLSQLEAAAVPHTDSPLPALDDGLKILTTSDLRPQLAEIRQPVHLIHGSDDALMPVEAAHQIRAALPCAHLSVFEHCGHASLLSRADECAALIGKLAASA